MNSIPPGVRYHKEVAIIPPLPKLFDRPLWIATKCQPGACPKWNVKIGDWVNQGQVLCSFLLPGFFSTKHLNIISPVTGLVLNTGTGISQYIDGHDVNLYKNLLKKEKYVRGITVAIPNSFYSPDDCGIAYRDFCYDVSSMKNKIFFEPGEFKKASRFSEAEVKATIESVADMPILKCSIQEYTNEINCLWQYNVPVETINALRLAVT